MELSGHWCTLTDSAFPAGMMMLPKIMIDLMMGKAVGMYFSVTMLSFSDFGQLYY